MTKEEQKRDKYYRKNFNIDLEEYNLRLEEQGRVCGACGNPPTNNHLSVEHDHKWPYLKLDTWKEGDGFWASRLAENQDIPCAAAYRRRVRKILVGTGKTKSEAIRQIRRELQRLSIRGLVCFPCNAAIRSIRDNADYAERLAIYLRRHQNAN